jgi:hypothetical protein
MKKLLPLSLLLTLTLLLPGCAWTKRHLPWHHEAAPAQPAATQPAASAPKSKSIVTPDESLAAKVVRVNTVAQFVVLNFPAGRMPKLDQHLFLYRDGLKTAEVKVVGPQKDTSIVADIVSGDAREGDAVRDQ